MLVTPLFGIITTMVGMVLWSLVSYCMMLGWLLLWYGMVVTMVWYGTCLLFEKVSVSSRPATDTATPTYPGKPDSNTNLFVREKRGTIIINIRPTETGNLEFTYLYY